MRQLPEISSPGAAHPLELRLGIGEVTRRAPNGIKMYRVRDGVRIVQDERKVSTTASRASKATGAGKCVREDDKRVLKHIEDAAERRARVSELKPLLSAWRARRHAARG